MSAVLPVLPDEICHHSRSHHHQQQQQDNDGDSNGGCGDHHSVRGAVPVVVSSSTSPDRDRSRLPTQDLKTLVDGSDAIGASPVKHVTPQVEVQKLKEALQTMRAEKDQEIAFLKDQLQQLSCVAPTTTTTTKSTAHVVSSPPPRLVPWMHSITERGDIQTSHLGRHASLKTSKALSDLQKLSTSSSSSSASLSSAPPLAERMAAAFLNPVLSLPYLHSIQFGADLVELSAQVSSLLESESRCLSLASPVYVFGDLHGNLSDLSFFSSHLWRFGFALTAGSFLFLGDYVDRGLSSLECVAYLFAHKLLNPHKVFLLRGNHETRAVNGLENYYGSGCFLTQCRSRFGHDEGYIVWHQINHAFDRLPLAATIDDSVFCVHGGIPRSLNLSAASPPPPPSQELQSPQPQQLRLLDQIRRLPTTAPMDVLDKKFYDANPQLTMVSDLLWGDPAREEHEHALDPSTGFGKSVLRGGNAVCFGSKAITDFLESHDFAFILRAHEATSDGVAVSKNAKVLTIFSTSKDHALGDDASCGCVLVDRDRIAAINRSAGQQLQLRRRRSVTSLQTTVSPGPPSPSSPSPPSPHSPSRSPSAAAATMVSVSTAAAANSSSGSPRMAVAPLPVAGVSDGAVQPAATTSTESLAAPRRRSSHRDAYPSSVAAAGAGAALVATVAPRASSHRRSRSRRRHDQDESDSTDDEAPPSAPPPPLLASGSSSSPFSRPRSGASAHGASADNNQSEDEA